VVLHEMRVCSRRSLVRNFQDSFTANCSGSYESFQDSVKSILTNEKREHTRIPCNATQFGGMRVCFNCDCSSSVKSGEVFFLPNFLYSMGQMWARARIRTGRGQLCPQTASSRPSPKIHGPPTSPSRPHRVSHRPHAADRCPHSTKRHLS
jgi:hypothetical protein